jgi:hypothetical protein
MAGLYWAQLSAEARAKVSGLGIPWHLRCPSIRLLPSREERLLCSPTSSDEG